MTVTDDEVEVPDAAPLPAEAPPPPAEGGGESTHDQDEKKETEAGPPPLPPLLEAAGSSMVTAGSGIYAAAGPAGLVAAMGVATVAGVAYGMNRRAKKNASSSGSGRQAGIAGRFFGTPGTGGRRGGRFGSLNGGRAGGRGTGGAAGLGRGRHRSANGAGGLTGAAARAARRNGARSGGLGSAGTRSGGRLFGPGGSGRASGSSLLGGGRGAAGSRGSGLFGGGSRSGPGAGRSGTGLFGGSTAGSRAGRSGGLGSSRRSGSGLFGGGAGRSARRGRGSLTSISDPAARTGIGRGRGHHRLRRVVKRGWEHPRIQRTRVRARKGLHRSRVRIRSHSKRLGDYLRRRKWTLRVKGWGHSFADWWKGIWSALTGRASDPRYGRLHGWQLGAAAVAIGALGAGKRKAQPRVLTGRIIGTAAPTPGQDGPITMAGRKLLALTGEGEEALAPEVQRIKDAADELKEGLARLGMSEVGMLTYEQALKQISPILGIVADGLKDLSTTAEDEQPLDPTVIEFMRTIEGAARGASEVADELPGLFRAAHEVELARLEAPRRGEHKWDVTQQD